jgi:hypothetical protein
MDPIAIGVAVGTALLSQLAKKLIENAVDPEVVAKSINWVFSAVDNFLKVRKKEILKDAPIPAPPSPSSLATPPAMISDSEIENKATTAENIVKSAKQSPQTSIENGIKLESLDEFAIEQLASEIASLMNQLETYLGNLHFEEEKAAQFGGLQFAPPIVMNTIRIQHEEIAKRVLRLNKCMQRAYSVSAPNLETLVELTKTP